VVIPARNEATHVVRAVRAVRHALTYAGIHGRSSWIVIIDDGSSDGTGELARRALGPTGAVLTGDFGSAGAARSAGFDRMLRVAGDARPLDQVWLATTDADSRVPLRWLAGHLRWLRQGVEAVAGMIEPEWERDTRPRCGAATTR